MKRVITMMLVLCSLAAAQGKQMVAIYMAGEEPPGARGVHNVLGGELAKIISQSERYSAVDRTDAILQQLSREHTFQRSGAVSDDQIKSLGEQFGAQYLCIANINALAGQSYYLDVRLVDVTTAKIIRTATASSSLKDAGEMVRAARSIAFELIENEKAVELTRQQETQRKRTKTTLLCTAIGLDLLGAGLLAYGVMEASNVSQYIKDNKLVDADKAATKRNAAFIAGGALLATGISIHIFF